MMKTERPLWGRGIMVSPQHFQQQAAYAAWTAEVIARMGLNHPWGVMEATFEPEMLKLGRLQAHRLQVRFQDGTMIDTDNADALPSALSLDGASGEAVIVLALPLMQANGGNCLKPEEVAERPVRFRQRWRDVRNQFGDDTRQIAVMQPELTLRFAHQDNSDYRSSFRDSAKWAVRIKSKPSSTPRGQGCPSLHCVMCRRRSRCVWKISISASMCPTLWRRKCCRAAPVCFTSRGCSVSLNLNFLRYYERE